MSVQVQILDHGDLQRLEKLLAGVNRGVDTALWNASQRASSYLRTHSDAAIRKRYAISAGNIKANETVNVRYTRNNGVQVYINYLGAKIPLSRFGGAGGGGRDMSRYVPVMKKGRWYMVHPSLPARGHVLTSTSPYTFKEAFMAQFGAHSGIVERTGAMTSGNQDELRELKSPSVPQMVGHEEVSEKLLEDTADKFEERLEHEIQRLLSGW